MLDSHPGSPHTHLRFIHVNLVIGFGSTKSFKVNSEPVCIVDAFDELISIEQAQLGRGGIRVFGINQ